MLADELEVSDVLLLALYTSAFEVVPAGAPALALVAAEDPERIRDGLPADALILVLVLLLDFLLWFFTFDVPLLTILGLFARILLLLVVEDDSLEAEGVEEGPFS